MTLSRRNLLTMSALALTLPTLRTALAQDVTAPAVVEELPPLVREPQVVPLNFALPPGEIHVDPDTFSLYLTLGQGEGIRYACGIGRAGLYEAGTFFVGARKEWPAWTPTPDMIDRQPELYEQYADGMPGGPGNPLGARALYLFTPERGDTFLRIHGTEDPSTIGTAVSNGCARLTNDQIVGLYDLVVQGAPVHLYPSALMNL